MIPFWNTFRCWIFHHRLHWRCWPVKCPASDVIEQLIPSLPVWTWVNSYLELVVGQASLAHHNSSSTLFLVIRQYFHQRHSLHVQAQTFTADDRFQRRVYYPWTNYSQSLWSWYDWRGWLKGDRSTFEEIVQDDIFTPLGLNHTFFVPPKDLKEYIVVPLKPLGDTLDIVDVDLALMNPYHYFIWFIC